MSVLDDLKKRLEKDEAHTVTGGMPVQKAAISPVRAAELKAACEANRDHPKAVDFLKSIEGEHPDKLLYVERVDLLAVVKNCDVEVTTTKNAKGRQVKEKQLGKSRDSNGKSSARRTNQTETTSAATGGGTADDKPAGNRAAKDK